MIVAPPGSRGPRVRVRSRSAGRVSPSYGGPAAAATRTRILRTHRYDWHSGDKQILVRRGCDIEYNYLHMDIAVHLIGQCVHESCIDIDIYISNIFFFKIIHGMASKM